MKLKIDKPCHENWEEMSRKEKGRFCKACETLVLDMTSYTDTQIIDFFKEKRYDVCGQFDETQIGRELVLNREPKSTSMKKYMVAASLVGAVFGVSNVSAGQDGNPIENLSEDVDTDNKKNKNKKKSNLDETILFIIKGKVIGGNGKVAVGVKVRVNEEVALTDKNGNFQISLGIYGTEPLNVKLSIDALDMEYKTIDIQLNYDKTVVDLGEIKLSKQIYHLKGKVAIDK